MVSLEISSDTYGRCTAFESGLHMDFMEVCLVRKFRGAVGTGSDGDCFCVASTRIHERNCREANTILGQNYLVILIYTYQVHKIRCA